MPQTWKFSNGLVVETEGSSSLQTWNFSTGLQAHVTGIPFDENDVSVSGDWTFSGDATFTGDADLSGANVTLPASFGKHWEALVTDSVANAASVDFTGLNLNYHAYLLVFDDFVPVTDSVTLQARFSTDNGSTFISTSSYSHARISNQGGTVTGPSSDAATQIDVAGGVANDKNMAGHLYIINPANGGEDTHIEGQISRVNTTPNASMQIFTGRVGVGIHNAFQLFFSSGNISTMNFTIFGLRKRP